ncbi:hypothetical protein [Azohydromonas caseinilytica]|uniref:Uncharacterized protein n=1 Tax=Azohydromonas caseinilytica TaxID=2728836 RepID=A0A848FGB9_9BURK|nr:hypothetical protein [Azohydromonas caseinilytica]NML17190.1 hypothetical protein [Azohydromonas caseinilytica]
MKKHWSLGAALLFGAALSASATTTPDDRGTVSAIRLSRAQPAATAALLRGVPEAPAVRKPSADFGRLAAEMNRLGNNDTRVGSNDAGGFSDTGSRTGAANPGVSGNKARGGMSSGG